ncbi:MAG: SDR family NAD(P)-dependent oxidoreductase [archaeon]
MTALTSPIETDGGESLAPPPVAAEDVLHLEDPRFVEDTVAIVTGAGSGIGRATALALAANGLTVAGLDIDAEGLEETIAEAERIGATGSIHPIEGDLTDGDDNEAAVAAAADLGQIRYLANIAGAQHIASLAAFPMERYELLEALMLRAPFQLAKLVIPHIEATDDGVGAIGNMSSVHGHLATRDKPAYITAKHGLTGLTRAIAAEGGGTLRGFSVSVGYVLTPLMIDQIQDTAQERGITEDEVVEDVMLGQARTKELMTPIEVANLFVFGFSRHARHLNGADLLFDGGFTHTYE